jgi:hypothetical protein
MGRKQSLPTQIEALAGTTIRADWHNHEEA